MYSVSAPTDSAPFCASFSIMAVFQFFLGLPLRIIVFMFYQTSAFFSNQLVSPHPPGLLAASQTFPRRESCHPGRACWPAARRYSVYTKFPARTGVLSWPASSQLLNCTLYTNNRRKARQKKPGWSLSWLLDSNPPGCFHAFPRLMQSKRAVFCFSYSLNPLNTFDHCDECHKETKWFP